MTQIRVNLSSRVNNASIRREKRNGRDVIVVPSAVAKFDTVLNGILYPKQELVASYEGLDKIPAPLGHPRIGNAYVSAREPEAINQFWSGGWNANPRIEGDRIMSEVLIDVEAARRHPDGERMLNAIDKGDPISTSTGLLLERDEVEGEDYQFVGRNFMWDHLAILLDEPPAIGPEDGVGLMVNGENTDTVVINSTLEGNDELPNSLEEFRAELMRAVEDKYGDAWVDDFNETSLIFYAKRFDHDPRKVSYSVTDGAIFIGDDLEEVKRKTTWEAVNRLFQSVKTMLNFKRDEAAGLSVNHDEGNEMPITEEQFKALEGKVDKLVANASDKPVAEQITEAVQAAVKPIQDQLQANAEAEKAKAKAEHESAVNKVVEAEILEKEVAETMDTVALNALAEKFGRPGASYGVNVKFGGGKGDDFWDKYDPYAAAEEDK